MPQGRTAAALADITDQASAGITELTTLIRDIRGGRGTVGKLMTDDALFVELQRFVATATSLTDGLRQGRGTLGKLLNDPATANALEASLKNVEALTRQINAGEGSLGKLLKDDSFSRSLTSATNNLDTLVARLNSGEGTARQADDRSGALQPAQFGGRAAGHAGDQFERRPGDGRTVAERQAVV